MSLSIDQIVRVTDTIEPAGILRRVFGIGLFLTTDMQLGTGGNRLQVLASFEDAAAFFAVDSQPYLAAQRWFSQSPAPKNLIIGRWINANAPAVLRGGFLTETLAEFKAIANGSFAITVNGTAGNIESLDFSGATSFTAIAAILQAAIIAALTEDVTVVFDSITRSFVVTTNDAGIDATLTYASPVSPASGTDISALLQWTQNTAAFLSEGANAETVEAALDALKNLNNSWFFITEDNSISDTEAVLAINAWVAAQRYMYAPDTTQVGCIEPGNESTYAAELFALHPERTWMTWTRANDLKGVSIAARFSSVNFDSKNSLITGMFKTLPGCLADDLSPTEQSVLDAKRVNYYTPFSGDDIYAKGTTFSLNAYIDVRYALDWFVNAVQVSVYDLLRASDRLAQTDDGEAGIISAINEVCIQAVGNGMCAPGVVTPAMKNDIIATTGNSNFNGVLTQGYLIWSQPTAMQSQSDRIARKATAKKIWLKSGGAIQSVDIAITLEN